MGEVKDDRDARLLRLACLTAEVRLLGERSDDLRMATMEVAGSVLEVGEAWSVLLETCSWFDFSASACIRLEIPDETFIFLPIVMGLNGV